MINDASTNSKSNYKWVKRKSLANIHLYNKYINWLSGEFDLYLQDTLNGLDIFFPGGKLNVNSVSKTKEDVVLEINLTCKNKSLGTTITDKVNSIHKQLEKMY